MNQKIHFVLSMLLNPKRMLSQLSMRIGTVPVIKKTVLKILYAFPQRNKKDKKRLVIGIFPTGGLGDYIISSKLVDEIKRMTDCRIDIFCENVIFGKAVFGDRADIEVMDADKIRRASLRYDVLLCIEHFVRVWSLNPYRTKRLDFAFYEKMKRLECRMKQIRPEIGQQCYREAVHFMRCEKMGIDRWTEQRCGDVFSITDHKTYIPMYEEYHARVAALGLDRTAYITVNRGADSMGRSGTQTKVWAKEYYDCFVRLFKEQFPNIKVVQLGVSSNDRIKGVDSYAFDESIEAVKWLLHDSLLHVDCEGGLVHLATQMETKCIVLFGPTPLHMYGYEQNINLQAGNCHNCMGLHENWAFECFRGMEQPECMYSITPEQVLTAAADYLGGNKSYEKDTG